MDRCIGGEDGGSIEDTSTRCRDTCSRVKEFDRFFRVKISVEN